MTNKPDPLNVHKARVAAAERELETARDAMRSRAKILGIPRPALFGDCKFVSRESAKSWVKDARAEMREEMREEELALTKMTFKFGFDEARRQAGIQTAAERAEDARWARVSKAIQSNARNAPLYETDREKCDPSYVQMRREIDTVTGLRQLCKAQGLEFSEIFGPGSLATPASMAMAERLIGGAQGRTPVDANNDPGNLASAIIESGRRRRGESDATSPLLRVVADNDEPVVMTPEGILLAGKRRRGEIQ